MRAKYTSCTLSKRPNHVFVPDTELPLITVKPCMHTVTFIPKYFLVLANIGQIFCYVNRLTVTLQRYKRALKGDESGL